NSMKKIFPNEKPPIEAFAVVGSKRIKRPDLSRVFLLKFPKETNIETLVQTLKTLPEVEYAEPNYIIKAFIAPNDSYYSGYQWNMKKIEAETAWNIETGEANTIVAVIDTGIDYNHEDLAGKIILGYDFINNDDNPIDDDGHGTHVAGVIGAITNNNKGVAGLNWNCKILAVKIMDSNGSGYIETAAAGINYAANNGANVINMSFGVDADLKNLLQDAVADAYTKGCVLVAAAGNENSSKENYPAAYQDYVIAVAATDQNDLRSSWGVPASNYGTWIDVCAPGTDIASTWLNNNYVLSDGTSMAAPHVSGLAALIFSQNPSISNENIRTQIENSCVNIDNLNPSYAGLLGHGRINTALAIGLPIIEISSPKNSSYVSGTIAIQGTATSTNFLDYTVQIGYGTSPSTFETICTGEHEIINGSFGTFDTTQKPDGIYTLKVVVRIKTLLTSEITTTINIDNTPPQVTITSPKEGEIIKELVTIEGEVKDANFSYYTLSSAKNSNFVIISASSTQSANSILGYWNTKGMEGIYNLKLTGVDLAGKENSQTISIDIISGKAPSVEIKGITTPGPNPFNPQTQSETYIYYNLSNNAPTTLYIFSISGSLIHKRSFPSGENGGKAGENLVGWNGKDLFGTTVGNGVYLYKITTDMKIIGSGRIIIVR
ncbi:hypothetical protein A3J90_07590, partial [candidate division WOR-1 bacterium RIFOXYC2_FULL_37_10]